MKLSAAVAFRALAVALFDGFARGGIHRARIGTLGSVSAGRAVHFLLVMFDELLKGLSAVRTAVL